MLQPLILASTSKPRRALLERLKIPFLVASPNVDETPLENENPDRMVLRLAEAKARKVAIQFPDAILIGADQVGVLEGEILGKPMTHEKAIQQLTNLSGKKVVFFIGLCLFDAKNQGLQLALENFSVTFKSFTQKTIENYLQREQVLHCAGSFKAEGLGIALVEQFHDTDFSALIGLPLIKLITMLENLGRGPLG